MPMPDHSPYFRRLVSLQCVGTCAGGSSNRGFGDKSNCRMEVTNLGSNLKSSQFLGGSCPSGS